jgi:serine/threonine protein kinase/Tol biopolymer transport system component
MPLIAGSRLDSYEIIAPLGAGGMGEVYRARDATLKRDVAIKVLPDYWSRDPERLRRFEQEAQATAALNHPNIVSIFHVGQYDGSPYIVTELLQGETLRERLRKGAMRLREVLDFGVELARGLAAAHDAGIVHRDLKPENTFVTKDGRVKILDFGLAKLQPAKEADADGPTASYQRQTDPGHVLGTVGYMSPEQVRGQTADARSDIFAAGVILYEMLTGKPAFRKTTSADTMSAILNEDPPSVSQIAPSVPPGLQRIVSRCLAKNPAQRLQHASDLEFALEALSDSGSAATTAVPQTALRRSWIRVALSALAIAILVALVAWWNQPPPTPVVEAVTQLTDDGERKIVSNLITDGLRVYFNTGSNSDMKIGQVAVSGGPTAAIPTRFALPQLVGVSADGSSLLAIVGTPRDADVPVASGLPLWKLPLPAGEPRPVGGLRADEADVCADGRILFSQKTDLYIADKDGSNPHKLLSANGYIGEPTMSPDGTEVVFTSYATSNNAATIFAVKADGSGVHPIVPAEPGQGYCCARWMPDGKYIVFNTRGRQRDLWLLPMKTGLLQRPGQPIRLTDGPLSYTGPVPSRDGKQVFAEGTKQRGELVRYDRNSKQFVPFLSGISVFGPTFSQDGQWVAYTSYPDHTLWRSRSDGSDRLQLTFPPVRVEYPFISADGKQVAYGTPEGDIYVIGTEGAAPRKISDSRSYAASWSPDGNLLTYADYRELGHTRFQLYDLRTGQRSVVPGSQDLIGVQWAAEDLLVAVTADKTKIVVFDLRTQKWSDLAGPVPDGVSNWAHSPDYKYVYFTTGGKEPEVARVRIEDKKSEVLASLKDFPLAPGPDGNTQISVAPDGSVVFTRNIGTQEIYALTLKWP